MKASGRPRSGKRDAQASTAALSAMLPLYGIKGVNGPSRGGRVGATAGMEEKVDRPDGISSSYSTV
jgi:hypothetical protein